MTMGMTLDHERNHLLDTLHRGEELDLHAYAILETIVAHLPAEEFQAATLMAELQKIQTDTTAYAEKYRCIYGEQSRLSHLPAHKLEWYVQGVELVVNAIRLSAQSSLPVSVVNSLYRFSPLPSHHFISPQNIAMWENPEMWHRVTDDNGKTHKEFKGEYRVKQAVLNYSRFTEDDYHALLKDMISYGDLDISTNGYYRLPNG